MTKINWTTASRLLSDPTGWSVLIEGNCFDLIGIECDKETHSVAVACRDTASGESVTYECANVSADVVAEGEPAYCIDGVLFNGNARHPRLEVRFAHTARAFAKTVEPAKREAKPVAKPVAQPSKPTVEQRLAQAKERLGARLVTVSKDQVVVLFDNMQGIKVTSGGSLTFGSVTANLSRLQPTRVESVAEGQEAPKLSPFAAKLYAALPQVGASSIEITRQEVIVRFPSKPMVRISNMGRLSIGGDTFNLHGQENVVVRQTSA
jgi:hypothetical protein